MDHSYEQPYCEDSESTLQDIYSEDSVSVTELNSEADATLIDIVRGYSHLYAKNLKDFKDKNVRERSWMEIASVLNCSVEDCQRRWMRLRERFSKERRLREAETRSGSGNTSGRKEFSLYQNMMFLSEHIQSRKTYTNIQFANQPKINAHTASTLSNAQIIQNPRSPTSSSSLSSSSDNIPFSSASSRHTPSSQIHIQQSPQNISLLENIESPPIRNPTPSPTSRNLIIPPQSTQNPQVTSLQENVSTLRRSENMQQEQNNCFGGWIKKRNALTLSKAIFKKYRRN